MKIKKIIYGILSIIGIWVALMLVSLMKFYYAEKMLGAFFVCLAVLIGLVVLILTGLFIAFLAKPRSKYAQENERERNKMKASGF